MKATAPIVVAATLLIAQANAQLIPNGANITNYQALATQFADHIGYLRVAAPLGEYGASYVAVERIQCGGNYYQLGITAKHVYNAGLGAGDSLYVTLGSSRTGTQYPVLGRFDFPLSDGTFNTSDFTVLLLPDLGAPAITLAHANVGDVVTTAGFGRWKTPSGSNNPTPDVASAWNARVGSPAPYASSQYYQFTDFGGNNFGFSNNGRSFTGFSGAGVFVYGDPTTIVGINAGHGGTDTSTLGTSAYGFFTAEFLAFYDQVKTNLAPERVAQLFPILGFSSSGPNLVLSWTGTFKLQSATNIAGPFVTVTNATSPFTNVMVAPQGFFRLAATNAP